jgi:hypothetical protein
MAFWALLMSACLPVFLDRDGGVDIAVRNREPHRSSLQHTTRRLERISNDACCGGG